MTKQKYIPPSFNRQIANRKIWESFLHTCEMMFDESESLMETKERIAFQIMQDMIVATGYDHTKKHITKMIKDLKEFS